jgi:hypothetical protein
LLVADFTPAASLRSFSFFLSWICFLFIVAAGGSVRATKTQCCFRFSSREAFHFFFFGITGFQDSATVAHRDFFLWPTDLASPRKARTPQRTTAHGERALARRLALSRVERFARRHAGTPRTRLG